MWPYVGDREGRRFWFFLSFVGVFFKRRAGLSGWQSGQPEVQLQRGQHGRVLHQGAHQYTPLAAPRAMENTALNPTMLR